MNYGRVVGEYSCYNSRFTLVLVAILLAVATSSLIAKGFLVKRS
ncbi:MAG: hypothetical protein RMI85_01515 [Candidatus Korarchaeum sp.]|nr:hypothetical protein [Candidatus Korarchaeum sp.]